MQSLFMKGGFLMIVEKYLNEWLEDYSYNLALNTVRGYRVNINHLCKHIGDIELAELNYKDIQHCYAELSKELSGTSVLYCHRVLRTALHHAERFELINKNPCDFVYPPKRNRVKFNILNEEELQILFNITKNTWLYLPVMLSAVLGLRRGEVLALQWSDVDFRNNCITVNHSASIINGVFTLSTLKTDKSHRTLLISSHLSDYLYSCYASSRCQYICNRFNDPISPNVLDKYFRKVCSSIRIPYIRFHDLRHTNATLLLKKGIPAKVVSERLGHSSVVITLDTYSHVLLEMQKESSVAFDDLI